MKTQQFCKLAESVTDDFDCINELISEKCPGIGGFSGPRDAEFLRILS